MQKKERKIILIAIVLFILLIAVVFSIIYFLGVARNISGHNGQPSGEEGISNADGSAEGTSGSSDGSASGDTGSPGDVSRREYHTSDKLSIVTLSRKISESGLDEEVNITVTGYLKEVDPESNSLTTYSDRAFDFEQGKVKWDIQGTLTDKTKDCEYDTQITGKGEDSISDLNVLYGKYDNPYDNNGNLIRLNDYGRLNLGYRANGYSTEITRKEISTLGKMIIPIIERDDVIVTKPSANVDAICDGQTESTHGIINESAQLQLPFTWLDVNPDNSQFRDSFVIKDDKILSGFGNAKIGMWPVLTTPLQGNGEWTVSWEFNFPK